MKKIILFMVSAFILIGTVRKGSDLLIEKQLNRYYNKNCKKFTVL